MLRSILLVAALLQATVTLAADPPAARPAGAVRPVALDDINRIESPDGPYLSRDGRHLAYIAGKQIFVVPTSGGAARAVTAAGSTASSPYWSKDGSALYFLSDRSGSSQLWKLPVSAFGEAQQVTTFEHGLGFENLHGFDEECAVCQQGILIREAIIVQQHVEEFEQQLFHCRRQIHLG